MGVQVKFRLLELGFPCPLFADISVHLWQLCYFRCLQAAAQFPWRRVGAQLDKLTPTVSERHFLFDNSTLLGELTVRREGMSDPQALTGSFHAQRFHRLDGSRAQGRQQRGCRRK